MLEEASEYNNSVQTLNRDKQSSLPHGGSSYSQSRGFMQKKTFDVGKQHMQSSGFNQVNNNNNLDIEHVTSFDDQTGFYKNSLSNERSDQNSQRSAGKNPLEAYLGYSRIPSELKFVEVVKTLNE